MAMRRRLTKPVPLPRAAFARALLVLFLSLMMAAQPAVAQQLLRDAETEALFRDIARPLALSAGLQPGNLKIVLLQDPTINAFVAGGQTVYLQSGLITHADNANQVQGVIAHELGHVIGGHVINTSGAKVATGISLLSVLLAAAAVAAGAGEAGMGILSAGQQAAMGKFLAFSRTQEASADAASVRLLDGAHISGRGSLDFFGKLRREEYRLSPTYADVDPYALTHPTSADRQAVLEADFKKSRWWNTPTDPAIEARFQRVKAELMGFADDPKSTFATYPESDKSIPARYARAYAWHRSGHPDKAVAEADARLAAAPHDPYFLELKGQILLESGNPAAAVPILREATERTRREPLIAALFGHALLATEDRANLPEAREILRTAGARDDQNPFAWYQLGVIYSQEGDTARAALASAERNSLEGRDSLALGNAEAAMRGIPEGTPDWIRAQDIAMVSRTALEDSKRKRR
jgi:predicted Zn-dependent protease